MGKCGQVGMLFRGLPILAHARLAHRGIHVGNPLRCLCGISPSIPHILFVPTRCVACVHESSCPLACEVVYNNIVVCVWISPSARLPTSRVPPGWPARGGRSTKRDAPSYSHCTGVRGGAPPTSSIDCLNSKNTKNGIYKGEF